jgi:hypothetical protein
MQSEQLFKNLRVRHFAREPKLTVRHRIGNAAGLVRRAPVASRARIERMEKGPVQCWGGIAVPREEFGPRAYVARALSKSPVIVSPP